MIEVGKAESLSVALGPDDLRTVSPSSGYFVAPTIFVDVPPESRLSREEIFGPVMCISRVSSYAEALEQANAVDYGLAASIVTRDLGRALSFARDIEAGIVKVNAATVESRYPHHSAASSIPAIRPTKKQAGHGVMDFYMQTKTVYLAG